jgi:signal transduction histidine kinase
MQYPVKQKLLAIPSIKEENEEVVDWLIERSSLKNFKTGGFLFRKGDPVEEMMIILEGEIHFMIEAGGNFLATGNAKTGDITGVLPFSRMTEAGGHSRIVEEVWVLALNKKYFSDLEKVSPKLVQKLVAIMSDRVRNFTMSQQQREKMEALGKLSAGIAHELNNPASAIRSASRELQKKWDHIQNITYDLMRAGIDMDTINTAKGILQKCVIGSETKLSLVEKSSLEDELIDYLDELGFEDSMDLAEVLVDKNILQEDLEKLENLIGNTNLEQFLNWYTASANVSDMINDIHEASGRISDLVGSIKSHSHMDRAPEKSLLDIRKGIESTLVIFQHKIRDKKIKLELNFNDSDTQVQGFEGELNQVWTNIIDNALDAVEEEGKLKIESFAKNGFLHILFEDNGTGIPQDIINQIFDPFFTTKSMGEGTGIGLDISKRIIDQHHGKITVESVPGKTVFDICLPVETNK